MESLKDSKFARFKNVELSTMSELYGGGLRKNVKTREVGSGPNDWTDTASQVEEDGEVIWVMDK